MCAAVPCSRRCSASGLNAQDAATHSGPCSSGYHTTHRAVVSRPDAAATWSRRRAHETVASGQQPGHPQHPHAAGRAKAIAEAVRVLRPGGRLLIADIRVAGEYRNTLRQMGLADVATRTLGWLFWYGGPRV